jgi:hypothetical protein
MTAPTVAEGEATLQEAMVSVVVAFGVFLGLE